MDIKILILLFISYSIFGWLMEVIISLIKEKKFINRGFLIGPYCPIYGWGALLITILLSRFKFNLFLFFIATTIVCSVLEYLTSYFLEKIFKARWWDYGDRKFNLNGRISLETTIGFAILGSLVIYIVNPPLIELFKSIPNNITNVICILLVIIYLIDNIISFKIISNVKIARKSLKDNTEEINHRVRELLLNKSILTKRIVKAFPKMQIIKRKEANNKHKKRVSKDSR